jgi:hypothetical protein
MIRSKDAVKAKVNTDINHLKPARVGAVETALSYPCGLEFRYDLDHLDSPPHLELQHGLEGDLLGCRDVGRQGTPDSYGVFGCTRRSICVLVQESR